MKGDHESNDVGEKVRTSVAQGPMAKSVLEVAHKVCLAPEMMYLNDRIEKDEIRRCNFQQTKYNLTRNRNPLLGEETYRSDHMKERLIRGVDEGRPKYIPYVQTYIFPKKSPQLERLRPVTPEPIADVLLEQLDRRMLLEKKRLIEADMQILEHKMGRETLRNKSLVTLETYTPPAQKPRLARGTLHLSGMGFTSHVTEECMVKAREALRKQL